MGFALGFENKGEEEHSSYEDFLAGIKKIHFLSDEEARKLALTEQGTLVEQGEIQEQGKDPHIPLLNSFINHYREEHPEAEEFLDCLQDAINHKDFTLNELKQTVLSEMHAHLEPQFHILDDFYHHCEKLQNWEAILEEYDKLQADHPKLTERLFEQIFEIMEKRITDLVAIHEEAPSAASIQKLCQEMEKMQQDPRIAQSKDQVYQHINNWLALALPKIASMLKA